MFNHTIQATIYFYYENYLHEFENIQDIVKFAQELYLKDTLITFSQSAYFKIIRRD